jgi:hypothetical protein
LGAALIIATGSMERFEIPNITIKDSNSTKRKSEEL